MTRPHLDWVMASNGDWVLRRFYAFLPSTAAASLQQRPYFIVRKLFELMLVQVQGTGSQLCVVILVGTGTQLVDRHRVHPTDGYNFFNFRQCWGRLEVHLFWGVSNQCRFVTRPPADLKFQIHQHDCKSLRCFAQNHVSRIGLAGGGNVLPESEHLNLNGKSQTWRSEDEASGVFFLSRWHRSVFQTYQQINIGIIAEQQSSVF